MGLAMSNKSNAIKKKKGQCKNIQACQYLFNVSTALLQAPIKCDYRQQCYGQENSSSFLLAEQE